MVAPTLHVRPPYRHIWLRDLFQEDDWAVHTAASVSRSGDTVTLALGARPLVASPRNPLPLPSWAVPHSVVAPEVTVPATGVVVARLLISTSGSISVYAPTISASWGYSTLTWITTAA